MMVSTPESSPRHHNPLLPGAERACRWLAGIAILMALAIGVSNALPWFDATRHLMLWPNMMVVRVNTALGLTGAALSLALWQGKNAACWRSRTAMAVALVPTLIGGLTSLQYLAGINVGIDQFFSPGTFPGDRADSFVVNPGRMSLNAALSLFFLGLALLGMDRKVRFAAGRELELGPLFALLAGLPALGGLVGYFLGTGGFTGMLRSTNILLHAAIALAMLAVGVLATRPHLSLMGRILSQGPDGILMRWMLPGSTILLLGLSLLVKKWRAAGLVAPGEGTAIMLYGGLILLFGLIFSAGKAVARQQASVRRVEEALRRQEETFRALADNISQLAWMTDATGKVVWYNKRWFDYTGTTAASMQHSGWKPIHHPDHAARVTEKMGRSFANGSAWEDLFPIRAADGAYRWFLSSARPIRDEAGRVQRWFGTNTDVTEQRELAEQLARARDEAEKANRAKDHFLAALSHELRTPLTPALLSAATLRNDPRLPLEVLAELTMIERNISLESRLIDDLLDLTRIAHGKLSLRTERCDAHGLARYAMEIIREEAQTKGVKAQLRFEATRSGLNADSARLQQVFWNLLRNALKFTPEGGSITLASRDSLEDRHLEVEVTDTGIGFDPSAAERLFRPFEQEEHESYHQFGGGLGLGLSIARAIVDVHGGTIRATSAGPGKGATFLVRLPGAGDPPTQRPTPAAGTATGAREVTGHRILLVEDHEPTLAMLQKLLTRAGYKVRAANSVATALAAMDDGPYDIVISDLGLPDGTGIQLMTELHSRDANLRGIAISGYGMESDLQRSRAAGFSQHLVKPVQYDQLLRALETENRDE